MKSFKLVLLFSHFFLLSACFSKTSPSISSLTPEATIVPSITPPSFLRVWLDESIDLRHMQPDSPLIIHFNQPMDPQSAIKPLVSIPNVPGEIKWNQDYTTLTFSPNVKFNSREIYRFSTSSALESQTGLRLPLPKTWNFRLPSPPSIAVRTPATNLLTSDELSFNLRFSDSVDRETIPLALSVDPDVALTFNWIEDDFLEITILDQPGPYQHYNFTLSEEAADQHGEHFESTSWSYRTPSFQIDFFPKVFPNLRPAFLYQFNYPVRTEYFAQNFEITPAFEYELVWDDRDTQVVIIPVEDLVPGQSYRFSTIDAVATAAGTQKLRGTEKNFQMPKTVKYVSLPARDELPPTFEVLFNYPMDTLSVGQALQIDPPFDYQLEWQQEGTLLRINPLDAVLSNLEYIVTFDSPIRLASGSEVNVSDPYPVKIPPPFVELFPPDGQVDATLAGPLVMQFDRPMDPATTLEAVSLSPEVDGEWTWQDDQTLLFTPDVHLPEETDMAVTLSSAALDASQHSVLGENFVWRFSTGHLKSLAGFGEYGSNVQVVDAAGPRTIQFTGKGRMPPIHYELFRVSVQQFISFQPGNYRSYYDDRELMESGDAPVVAAWEQSEDWLGELKYSFGEVGETTIPESVPPGIYLLNMNTTHLDDQLLVVLSANALDVKLASRNDGSGQLTAWLKDMQGSPVAAASVRVYSQDGIQLAAGLTNSIGIFKTELATLDQAFLVVARSGNDVTATGVQGLWRTRGVYYFSWRSDLSANQYFAYLYTDRPIYRPGDTVHYKGVVRRDRDAQYSLLPEGQSATLNVRDGRGNLLESREVVLNAYGTFDAEFELIDGAMLGDYTLELLIGQDTHTQVFKVQEYEKPDMRVQVRADSSDYLAGETVRLDVDVQYLLGKPVDAASLKVQWYSLGRDWRYYYGDADLRLNDPPSYYWYPINGRTKSGNSDENGFAQFDFIAQFEDQKYYDYDGREVHIYAIEVTADDGTNRPISSYTIVRVHNQAFQLDIDRGGFLHRPDQDFSITAQLSSVFGDPVDGVELELAVERYAAYRDYKTVFTNTLTSNLSGSVSFAVNFSEQGFYRFTLSGYDLRGNYFDRNGWFYIHDQEGTWLLDFGSELNLRAEKTTLQVGETARLAVESSISGRALVTIERGSVIEERLLTIKEGVTFFEVPIKAHFSPNVYVVIQAWQPLDGTLENEAFGYEAVPGHVLRVDAIMLAVPEDGDKLNVSIASSRQIYQPREDAQFDILVTDQNGDPVTAELSLALVDEAIFLLAEDPSGDIHAGFNRLRGWGVYSYDSYSPWRVLVPPGGMGGGGGGDDFMTSPRADFPDTALWVPSVVTDSNGRASVNVTLPDTLTSWRLTVKAVTRSTQVGQSHHNVVTQLPLSIRPLPPQGLIEGDRFTFSAIVHNFSERPIAALARIESDSVEIRSALSQTLRLEPGEQRIVSWQAVAPTPGDAEVTIRAAALNFSDAVTVSIAVEALIIPEFTTETGVFQAIHDYQWEVPENALPGSTLHVEISSSVAGSLLNGLEYLTGYPYGCVEQVMSRALPTAVVARAFNRLGLTDRAVSADLEKKIVASVQRLYAFQHWDGGWGWWYSDNSDDYQTAWVVFGLALIQDAGYQVEPKVIERGAEWLQDELSGMDIRTRAFALYAMSLAGYDDPESLADLLEQQDALDDFSRAALALTLHSSGDEPAAAGLVEILSESARSDIHSNSYWRGASRDQEFHRKTMASDTRTTALVLDALLTIDPSNELIPSAADWLLSKRTHYGWGTTNETSFTILALSNYILQKQEASFGQSVQVLLDGNEVASFEFAEDQLLLSLDIPVEQLHGNPRANLRIVTDGQEPLFYSITNRVYVKEDRTKGQGISVKRSYLDAKGKRVLNSIQAGQLVIVELTVTLPEDGYYLILEDYLPGGLVAVNENLNITSYEQRRSEYYYYDEDDSSPWRLWINLGYNYKEIRGARVSFFITHWEKGSHTIRYLARAVNPGEYYALPVQFYAMYDEAFWGRTGLIEVIISQE